MNRFTGLISLMLALSMTFFGCGGGGSSTNFDAVVGLPEGNGAGTALSGIFTVLLEVTSNGCADDLLLGGPSKGQTITLEVEVEHGGGAISFEDIETELRGGVTFDSKFEVGGAAIVDRGGEKNNILQTVRLKGEFQDANSFEGEGDEELFGRVSNQTVRCSFSFNVSGIRKE